MARFKDTAISNSQLAIGQTKKHNRKTPDNRKNKPKTSASSTPRRRGRHFFRFNEARGKTVDFVEMFTGAEFPCVEVAFEDQTALLFELGTRLTMEPMYSLWKSGNQRVLKRWPLRETSD